MSGRLRWDKDGRNWPHREASDFVESGGLTWHVQQMGPEKRPQTVQPPVLLLLHGTGGASHSWRDMMPALAEHFTVIVPDLPGHAFTSARPPKGMTLEGISASLTSLLDTLGVTPAIIAGHSAGVAIALQYVLDTGAKTPVVGFNPALMPFPGLAAKLFPAMAKVLFVNPLVPRIFARIVSIPGEAERFLRRATGSKIDAAGMACYAKLLGNSRHCEAGLSMMANWDLEGLKQRLPNVAVPVLLAHWRGDIAVPGSSVEEAAKLIEGCDLRILPQLGHLAHEEDPQAAVAMIIEFAQGAK